MQPSEPALTGQLALVTGAASGLGAHFARLLASHGAEVICAGRRECALDAVTERIAGDGGQAHRLRMDVSDPASVDDGFARIAAERGRCPGIIVNNAGIASHRPALDLGADDWSQVLATNLSGPFLVAQAAARQLIAAGQPGSIINIASILGLRVAGGVAAYAASKAGLIHLTKALALEWARYGIRVNAIAPGYIETDLNRAFFATDAGERLRQRIPQRRLGQLDDLSPALLLLASAASGFMTGSVISVDGGHLCGSL
jgi:NAD(P)-dependent dehydrogenase (short-subunit alcohol dehydrogenase family)